MPVVKRAKAFKETIDEAFTLIGSISELMAVEVINARRNDDVLKDIERRRKALNKVVEQVVVRVGTIMEVCAKRRLPFLCLQYPMSIHVAAIETFKVIFANRSVFRPRRKLSVDRISDDVCTIYKSHFGIEIGLCANAKSFDLDQIAVVVRVNRAGPVMPAQGSVGGKGSRQKTIQ